MPVFSEHLKKVWVHFQGKLLNPRNHIFAGSGLLTTALLLMQELSKLGSIKVNFFNYNLKKYIILE